LESRHSKADPRPQQDWILKCLQGGRAHSLAACGVVSLCYPPHWKPKPSHVCVWVVCVCAAGSSPPPSTISCPLPPPPPPPPPPLLPPPVSAPCNPAPQAVRGVVHGYGRTQTAYQQPTPCDCRELVYANSSTSRRIESKCSRSTPPLWVLCVTEPCSFTLLRWSSESPVSLSAV
jgi:hypothetical protein